MMIQPALFAVVLPLSPFPQPHFCYTGPRAERFLQRIRGDLSPRETSARPYGIAPLPPNKISLVVNDSTCAAVSRVLGGAIRSGGFPRQDHPPPFPVAVVRAGPKFFVHDTSSDSVYVQGILYIAERFVPIDTLRPRPTTPYVLPEQCWLECCTPGRWTLLTPVTLNAIQALRHLPSDACPPIPSRTRTLGSWSWIRSVS